jgi:D-glycero-D-manno-heptose 1,7-bisphosphate phosphatase
MPIETIFFDRDGVINDVVRRANVISSPRSLEEFHIKKDFIALYKSLPPLLNIFVVSNQPDINRQILELVVLDAMHNQLLSQFAFREIMFCPHDDIDLCHCRKPKPGMINDLLLKYQLNKDDALIIGDSDKDIKAGLNAGIRTAYYQQEYNRAPSCQPHFVINQLSDILDIIDKY